MGILLVYFAINVILAATIERKHNSVVTIFHAVLFAFTSVLLWLCADNGIYAEYLQSLLGEELYDSVLTVVFCNNMFVPFAVVEFALVLQALVVMWLMTRNIVEYLQSSRARKAEKIADNDVARFGRTPPRYQFRKLYSLFEVIRC